jgi:hypothetical protein
VSKQNITPEDSVVPVYLEPITKTEMDTINAEAYAMDSARSARQTKLNSAITKLKALGLTESEAKIIIGLE